MMHPTFKSALGVLAVAIVAVPAAAQFGPSGPQPAGPLWGESTDYASKAPILTADLGARGHGAFTGVVDSAKNQLCYMMNVSGLDEPTAAHIHLGGAGQDGAPVVTLKAPANGSSGGCVAVPANVIAAMVAQPAGYYVNIHTKTMPGGAVRGQLVIDGAFQAAHKG
jgi:hypothetical protein